ncbi:hypothetical protein [Primorskyibacter sp. 2E233]|uniref:hypothetical protein n=1 Tax=Primorskyibacter sp. 2E233 TaxID=3413431 RepID=UPI003BF03759
MKNLENTNSNRREVAFAQMAKPQRFTHMKEVNQRHDHARHICGESRKLQLKRDCPATKTTNTMAADTVTDLAQTSCVAIFRETWMIRKLVQIKLQGFDKSRRNNFR